jgi:electron transfer flavoprotein alpha subunit
MVNILTLCFAFGEEMPRAALETIAGARRLADELRDGRVQTLLVGPKTDVAFDTEKLIHFGTDELFVAGDGRLQPQQTSVILELVEHFVRERPPEIILLPHDNLGSEIGSRLAYRLEADIVTDCTGFKIVQEENREEVIHWLKPVYGGKALAYIVSGASPQLATFRAKAFEPLPADDTRRGRMEKVGVKLESPSPVRLVESVREETAGVTLDQAEIVVAGGRGMGGEEGFSELEKLAEVLGAAVGGSRPAADLGWIPHSRLLGQTGKIVAPDLYLAVGISGAPQHMAGAGASKTIVAINKDPDAPIFKVAHLGVVDEWQNIIPVLVEEIGKL